MAPNVIETDPGTNYEMADLRDSFYTMAVPQQTTSAHTTAAQHKGKYSCPRADDALSELNLSSASTSSYYY